MSAAAASSASAQTAQAGPSLRLVGLTGHYVVDALDKVGQWTLLWLRTNDLISRGRITVGHVVRQVEQLGIGSAPMAALAVTFSSMVLAFYTIDLILEYGLQDFLGRLIGVSVFREIGPVLSAIVIASREGSRISAELAAMKITEQIDALRSMATDPVEYLVVPRYLGALIGVPLVTVLASAAGVFGGYIIASANAVASDVYWSSVARGVEFGYFTSGLIKALIFGAIIAIISCWQGLSTGYGAEAVGRSVTISVVLCVLVVHVADFGLALVFGG